MQTKTDIPKSLQNINLKRVLRKSGIYEKQARWLATKEAATPMAKQFIRNRRKAQLDPKTRHSQFSDAELQSYWEKQIHIVEVLEARFDNKLRQFIGKMVDGFLAHLEQEVGVNKSLAKVKDYFDDNESDLLTQAQIDFTPLLGDLATLAGQEAMKLAKSQNIYDPENLRKVITANVNKFTQSMIDTDRQTLIDIITNGLSDGQSIPQIRGEITTTFDTIQKTQAQRITRTEVLRVSNQASIDAYKQSGVVDGLQWLTAGADDECANYEGQIISLDGSFYEGDNEFQDGNPPLHPNCRCVVVPVIREGI